VLAALGLVAGSAAPLCAQAWVPPRGEGTVTATFQTYVVPGHFDRFGRKNNNGGTFTQTLILDLDYGVTDTWALDVSLPFIASKYTGPPTYFVGPFETHPGPLDTGKYHAAFQDLRVEARRMFLTGPIAVAPFVGALLPTHEYETVGEAVPGRHRSEIQVGAAASAELAPVLHILSGTVLHARYAYAASERVDDLPFTRSTIDLEGHQPVASRVALRALFRWQIAHTGPELSELEHDWTHHDRFIAPSYFNVGAGTSVSLTRSTDLDFLWIRTVSGRNGAHRARLLSVGATWSFGGSLAGLGIGGALEQSP